MPDTVTIFHNPRCSKSRQTLSLLEERQCETEVILYLETPPDEATLGEVLSKLGMQAHELLRAKESRELGIDKSADEATLIAAMRKHPRIIERPIVVVGERARIGRPPESVLEIL